MLPSAAFAGLLFSERSVLHQTLGRRQAHALPCRYSAAHGVGQLDGDRVHAFSMPFAAFSVKGIFNRYPA
jgi:hypothetical protein